jgi:hypothetical protein
VLVRIQLFLGQIYHELFHGYCLVHVATGDIVVKGPRSADVVQLAMDIGALSVRGNHDHSVGKEYVHLQEVLQQHRVNGAHPSTADSTPGQGGHENSSPTVKPAGAGTRKTSTQSFPDDTVRGKLTQHLKIAATLTPAQAAWLAELPYCIRSLDLGAIFVHAGLQCNVPLASQVIILSNRCERVIATCGFCAGAGCLSASEVSKSALSNTNVVRKHLACTEHVPH